MIRNRRPSPLVPLALLATLSPSLALECRSLSTDRPDTTESPYSVDAGHFQFEMELAAFTRDGGAWSEFTLGELNAKYGLNDSSDLQVVMPFYSHSRDGKEGFGDVQIRLKHNLWGNDEGATALAVMPFVKLPTANSALGNGDFEAGLIIPFGFAGPAEWSFGVMAEVDLVSDEDGGGYQPELLLSATGSHHLTGNTGIFIELVGILTPESGDEQEAYFNCGMTWAISDTWQLDGGIRAGLTAASTDLTPFLGISTKY